MAVYRGRDTIDPLAMGFLRGEGENTMQNQAICTNKLNQNFQLFLIGRVICHTGGVAAALSSPGSPSSSSWQVHEW